jgi:cysteine desulfurase family protein (TIGR01976 family)
MALEIDAVRAQYPALAQGYAHFDGAAGTLVAAPVAAAVAGVLGSAVANRTTAFEPGRVALRIVADARVAVADLLGADPAGVVFGSSATSLTYLFARTLAAGWQPGDEVVVTRLDHDANVRPWLQVAGAAGVTVRFAEFHRETGELPVEAFAGLVNRRTRLVAVTAASNAVGTRPDVPAIAALARRAGALCYVDGVHATPHQPTDIAALGCDFYVTSGYKWSGPHIAALAADPALLESLRPDKLAPSPDNVPERFEHGTPSFELLAGVTAAVEHLATLAGADTPAGSRRQRVVAGLSAARVYADGLFARLAAGLAEIPGVRLLPAPADRAPTLAFRLADQHPQATAEALGKEGVCVFAGDYYAYEYFTAMGLRDSGGAVRASVYHYTSEQDVDRLLAGVRALTR